MGYGKNDEIGQWSVDKLSFLERYLPAFAKATKKAKQRYYIDGFCGKGVWTHKKTKEKIQGSASIALNYSEDFTHQYFIDLDNERINEVKEIINKKSILNKATAINGDCNVEIINIMKKIHKRAPTFVFLDPSGDHIHWKTIQYLSNWRTELFILFPYHITIRRFLPIDINKQAEWMKKRLNEFFGTNKWEEIYYQTHRNYLASKLLELYTSRLNDIGYIHCNVSDVFKTDTGQNLYYMIWVGKHPVGKKIMNYVFEKQSDQLKLF